MMGHTPPSLRVDTLPATRKSSERESLSYGKRRGDPIEVAKPSGQCVRPSGTTRMDFARRWC